MRIRVITAIVVALLVVPGLADAKGPSSATIVGAGLSTPISVDSDDVANLRDDAGYFAARFGQTPDPIISLAPTDDLGPVLTIDWYEGPTVSMRQQLYPYAATGALVFTEPAQGARTGWYRAQPAIGPLLARLGVPDRATLARASVPAPATTTAVVASSSKWPVAAITIPLIAALLAMLVTGWRRQARVAPA